MRMLAGQREPSSGADAGAAVRAGVRRPFHLPGVAEASGIRSRSVRGVMGMGGGEEDSHAYQ